MKEEGCWIEIRPLSTSEVKPLNFKTILNMMYGTGKPFKFVIVNMPSERIPDQHVVRFFLGVPDEITRRQIVQTIQAMLPVQTLEATPPKKEYPRKVEMSLQRHFALPIVDLSNPPKDNLVDTLVSVLSETGGAIEIVGVGDRRARADIYRYILERSRRVKKLTRQMIDTLFNVGAEIAVERDVKLISREAFWRTGRATHIDEWLKQEIKAATLKMQESAFHCEVNVYGDPGKVYEVGNMLPAWLNRLRTAVTKRKQSISLKVDAPAKFTKQRLWYTLLKIFPLVLLGVALWRGMFKPLEMLSGKITVTELFLIGVILVDLLLLVFHRKRKKVVLSATEVSSIVGLPSAIGKLPVELGTIAPSRRGLVQLRGEEKANY